MTLVEDLLHIGLAARCGDDLSSDGLEPIEPLLTHLFGENGNRFTTEQNAVVGSTTAVVTGRWPDSLLGNGIEVSGHQCRGKTRIGGPYLMSASREPFSDECKDPCFGSGDGPGNFHEIDIAECTTFLNPLIFPVDPEQILRVDIPKTHGP